MIFSFSVVIFLLTPSEIETSPAGWNKKIDFTPAAQKVSNFSALSKENLVAVAYEAQEKGFLSLFVKISLNSGKDFFNPVKITDANLQERKSEYKLNPNLSVSSDGKLFLVWQDFDKDTLEPKIYFSSSLNAGAVWTVPGEFKLPTSVQFLPKIIYDGKGTLHVFYHVYENDAFYLYHMYETGDGTVYSKPEKLVKLSGTFRGAFFPAIISSGKEMHIVWQGKGVNLDNLSDDLFYMNSTDYGRNFSKSVRITSSPANDASPYLLINNGKIFCSYLNNSNGNWEIFLTESENGGKTWIPEPLRIFQTNINCYDPVISSDDNGNVVFFWYNIQDGRNKIFSRKYMPSSDEASKFSTVQDISENKADAHAPSILNLNRNLTCLWLEGGTVKGKSVDTYAAPPEVFSTTHPFDQWSKKSIAYINWKRPADESGIAGYATFINKEPDFNPTIQNYEAGVFSTRTGTLDDGITYFHIRTIDNAGNMSRTVHFPLLISSTPVQLPLISSDTHKEGEKTGSRNVHLTWTVNDLVRVKGYRYSLTLNSLAPPDKFISANDISFSELPDGRYFFQVQAVDKTNTSGRTATYEIIIGDVPDVDADYYAKIAANQKQVKTVTLKTPRSFVPVIPEFNISFSETMPLKKPSSTMKIAVANRQMLKGVTVTGFRVKVNSEEKLYERPDDPDVAEISVSGLHSGENTVSVAVRYQYVSRGRLIVKWTDESQLTALYSQPDTATPLERFEKILVPGFAASAPFAAVLVLILLAVSYVNGFSVKTVFYLKSFFARIVLHLKLMISNVI